MNVSGNYLKNEKGNIFSPIVSTDTIYYNGQKLTQTINTLNNTHIHYVQLWSIGESTSGNNTIPSKSNGGKLSITLNKPLQYGTIMFQIGRLSAFTSRVNGEELFDTDVNLTMVDYSNWGNELINFFGCVVHKVDSTHLEFSGGCLCQIHNDLNITKNEDYKLYLVNIFALNLQTDY